MYQFSLDAYISLFVLSIDKSHRSNKLEDRIDYLNEYHTYAVYRYTCRTLFERHKLLFSFQMCAKILETSGKLNMDEYNFFLRGGLHPRPYCFCLAKPALLLDPAVLSLCGPRPSLAGENPPTPSGLALNPLDTTARWRHHLGGASPPPQRCTLHLPSRLANS
ncbi:dynein heavy chain 2, axonemal-like [Suricata suricatta]|uniref:dynein heavy chain 2, axonemal-like n=1 Tax=Suricata suricatta TaxID=37032 RepID=UPI00115561BE|nr:dynein heavy chain 2, axonemal-like [Suricata suricatta]